MSFREYQEWIMLLNSLSSSHSQSGGSGSAWQNQLKTMKAISAIQQLGGKRNGRN